MTSTYKKITFQSSDESLIALLNNDFPFEAFEEYDDYTIAYILQEDVTPSIEENINTMIKSFEVAYTWDDVEDQNWNEIWESNFQPVSVENLCYIRAEFHETNPAFQHEIVIQPKMAFGTGHHQTTYLMIKNMSGINMKDQSVLDYGCGTGILAIYASMLGANPIAAVDIEHESYLNTIENAARNHAQNIHTYEGDIHVTPNVKYDIILANINRNILLDSAISLSERCHQNTTLLLSGILVADIPSISETYRNVGFTIQHEEAKEGWVCMVLRYTL